jgi:hypothetical protein
MCICLACSRLQRCTTYHRVETEHGMPHLNSEPDFNPQNPRIHVSVQPQQNSWAVEWDVRSCDSFAAKLTSAA